ncbi:hypothetical protein [Actinomadura macrotermitis]|uniref:hypothetical protein n=1 Tax=Actinomadura macrotermitis TaxID=2585200 RepID=UPI001297F146|nr:hypothetical protein [Actinomadura macrotermitis]
MLHTGLRLPFLLRRRPGRWRVGRLVLCGGTLRRGVFALWRRSGTRYAVLRARLWLPFLLWCRPGRRRVGRLVLRGGTPWR